MSTSVEYSSMAQVIAAFPQWFAPDTMAWWGSRVESPLIRGRWFITSEDGLRAEDPRQFTIREIKGTIQTFGEFQAYDSYQGAIDAIPSPPDPEHP